MARSGISPQNIEILLRDSICDRDSTELTQNAKIIVGVLHDDLVVEKRIPYDFIAEYVFGTDTENSPEKNEILNTNIEILLKHFKGCQQKQTALADNLEKIRTHYALAQIQKEYITKASKDVGEIVNKLVPVVGTIEEQTKKSKRRMADIEEAVESVKDTKSGIYTDFIAILGVFSAFVFLMFGGIDVVRAVIDVADDLQSIPLSRLVILGSLMLIAVLTMLYCLLLWIARITGKTVGSCHKVDCKEFCKHKWKHFYYRHSFYFSLMFILAILVAVAYICGV